MSNTDDQIVLFAITLLTHNFKVRKRIKSTPLYSIRQTHSQMMGNWMCIKDPSKASRMDQIDQIDTIVFHSTDP